MAMTMPKRASNAKATGALIVKPEAAEDVGASNVEDVGASNVEDVGASNVEPPQDAIDHQAPGRACAA